MVPAAPTLLGVPGDPQNVQVTWVLNAPADAGCPVTSSIVNCTSATGASRSTVMAGSGTTAFVSSLDYGATYTCSVVVSSGTGSSLASPASTIFTVGTVPPSLPRNVVASFPATGDCDLAAAVSWDPPASNGGSAISGYTVTCAGSPAVGPVTFSASPATLVLGANQAYTCSVAAINGAGTGSPSTAPVITRCELGVHGWRSHRPPSAGLRGFGLSAPAQQFPASSSSCAPSAGPRQLCRPLRRSPPALGCRSGWCLGCWEPQPIPAAPSRRPS
jgi:hypothetical protein